MSNDAHYSSDNVRSKVGLSFPDAAEMDTNSRTYFEFLWFHPRAFRFSGRTNPSCGPVVVWCDTFCRESVSEACASPICGQGPFVGKAAHLDDGKEWEARKHSRLKFHSFNKIGCCTDSVGITIVLT